MVASPECTPANSMCSLIAYTTISPFCATASISTSLACSMNWLTTTGCFFDTLAASCRKRSSSSWLEHTFMAAPESTYDGRTSTGNPTFLMKALISSIEVSALHSGWSTPMRSSIAENLSRSSALSMLFAEVPKILICCASRRSAKLFGICPPVDTMTPCGFSKSRISITRSKVNSSKYRRSHIS